ncbi:putative reverse transcriptase domain-containing protein [Tanacetum coccineum]
MSWKRVVCFEKKGKLAPRYVEPFKILERITPVAYWLRLPEELSGVHDMFHVSNLKRSLADASFHVPLDEIKVDKTLCYVEEPVEIIDREVKSLKRSRISLVKVRWNFKHGPEFTWEREGYMKSKYPQLFVDSADESAKEVVEHQVSTPRTLEQNGVVERQNRTLIEAARTMLLASKLPLFFWAEAIATAYTTVPSQLELDLLFGPLYDEFSNVGNSSVNKSSCPTDNSKQQDTPPTTNIQSSTEPTTPTNVNAEENNDNQAAYTQF